MASVPPVSLPIDQLSENFFTVIQSHHSILDPTTLKPVPGKLSNSPHNKIYSLTLTFLEKANDASPLSKQSLASLYTAIGTYNKKATLACKSANKEGAIDSSLFQKLCARIESLSGIARKEEAEHATAPPPISNFTLATKNDAVKLQWDLSYIATEWYAFRALDLTVTLYKEQLKYREMLLSRQYRFSQIQAGFASTPPEAFFTAPWPILLLYIQYAKVMREGGPKKMDSYRPLILRIKKAQELYPQHKEDLDTILIDAEWTELTWQTLDRMVDCGETITVLSCNLPRNGFGQAMIDTITTIQKCIQNLKKLNLSRNEHFTKKYRTADEEFEAGVPIESSMAEFDKEVSDILSQCVDEYKKSLEMITKRYAGVYMRATDFFSHLSPKKQAKGIDAVRTFTPFIPNGIFEPNSPFSNEIHKKVPSPEELLLFPPFSFVSAVSTIVHEYDAEKLKSATAEEDVKLSYLPPLPSPSAKRPDKNHTKRSMSVKRKKDQALSTPMEDESVLKSTAEEERKSELPQLPPEEERTKQLGHEESSPPKPEPALPTIPALTQSFQQLSLNVPPHSSPHPAEGSKSRQNAASLDLGFCNGQKSDPTLRFSTHVSRWTLSENSPNHPFNRDPLYTDRIRPLSAASKEAIQFQHTPPLAVINVLLAKGERYVHTDKVKESFYLPAEATFYDGSNRFEKGVITLGRNLSTGEIFHYHFSQMAPSTLRALYAQLQFLHGTDDDAPADVQSECPDFGRTLGDDGSQIENIEDTGIGVMKVTIDDPRRHVKLDVFF